MSKYLLLYSGTCDPLVITAKNDADLISQVINDVLGKPDGTVGPLDPARRGGSAG